MKSDKKTKGKPPENSRPQEAPHKFTKREQSGGAGQQEQRSLEALMAAISAGVLVFDENLDITYANPAAEALCNIRLADLEERRCGNFFHCINRHDDPRGCGNGRDCSQCPIYTGLTKVIQEGISGVQGEAMLRVERQASPLWVKFGINAMEIKRLRFAVLTVVNITGRKRRRRQLGHRKPNTVSCTKA